MIPLLPPSLILLLSFIFCFLEFVSEETDGDDYDDIVGTYQFDTVGFNGNTDDDESTDDDEDDDDDDDDKAMENKEKEDGKGDFFIYNRTSI